MSETPITVWGADGEAGETLRPVQQRRPSWRVALPTLVVAAVGVVVAVLGFTATGNSSPSATPSAAAPSPGQWGPWAGHGGWNGASGAPWAGGWGPGGTFDTTKALHGEVVVAKDGGGTQTMLIQKGAATQVGAASITLKSSDGYTKTYQINGDTLVNGAKGKAASIAANTDVVVIAVADGDKATAQTIIDAGQFGKHDKVTPTPTHS